MKGWDVLVRLDLNMKPPNSDMVTVRCNPIAVNKYININFTI
jgi:hypothetical protein